MVTGYTGGYYNRFGDYWIVRRLDAHAWAEVWLEGRGWVRADPTAAVAPERIYDTIEDRAGVGGGLFGDAGGLSPMLDMTDWLRRGWNDFVLGFDASRQRQLFRPLGLGDMDGARLAALFSLVAALALLWMAWLSRNGEREPDPVLRAWRALGQRYVRLGLEPMPHETARDWAARVGRAQPHLAAELNALSEDFSDWRYAAPTPGHDAVRDLVRRLRAHRPTGPRPARNPGERR